MKYTTVIAAALATGAAADDWQSWTPAISATVCPDYVTSTVTKHAECAEVTSDIWQTTITVEIPKTRTVTVYADDKTAKSSWEDLSQPAESAIPFSLPYGCVPHVVTETEYSWIKKPGSTTTATHSILYVSKGEQPTTTVTAKPIPGSKSGSDNSGSGNGPANWDNYDNGNGPEIKTVPGGYKIPVYETIVATDNWVWNGPKGTNTKSYEPPVYTQKPDGTYGSDGSSWTGAGLNDGSKGSGSSTGKGSDGKGSGNGGKDSGDGGYGGGKGPGKNGKDSSGGYGPDNNGTDANGGYGPGNNGTDPSGGYGPGKNETDTDGGYGPGNNSTDSNGTVPINNGTNGTSVGPGDAASNVTQPILPLTDRSGCNTAGSRGSWCGGKTVSSNYYEDYFSGKTCTAELTLVKKILDVDGTRREYITFNGQMPGPLIECNWGDMIQVTVHNSDPNNGTSVHWHGFRQVNTNHMDGVPGITECPIAPGGSKTYTFHASSYGTTWYHSHWISQYGDGAYGPIIIHGPATANYDEDMGVVAIQDTFNSTAAQQNDIIAHEGPKNTANYLLNGHNTKYDLSGGQHTLWSVEAGKKYMFRFLNAAAQNMFSVSLDKHVMTVIAADFVPVSPYQTQWINIGIGQRYDVIIEMNQAVDSYFLRAVTQTQCPSGCDNTGLGNANGIVAYKGVSTAPYLLPTSTTTKTLADFNICADEPLASLVPYVPLGAGSSTAFSASVSTLPVAIPAAIQTADDGVVFKWFLNNGAININFTQPTLKSLAGNVTANSSLISNPIVLSGPRKWVYFVIQNQFFAAHPIHLHGHDFSLLGQGHGSFDASMVGTLNFNNPMRRDTAMLMGAKPGPPGNTGYTVIGFETDNPGSWLMHCHIIWHVDGGLALQWVERPEDMALTQWVDSSFQNQCKAYARYEAEDPSHRKLSGSAGLKKRSFFDEQLAAINGEEFGVVRRSDSVKRFLDNKLRRSFGDSHGARHAAHI